MELALSLGDTPKPILLSGQSKSQQLKMKEVGFCMGLESSSQNQDHQQKNYSEKADDDKTNYSSSSDPPKLQLDLLPFSPSHQVPPPPTHRPFPWLSQILGEPGSEPRLGRGLDVKPITAVYDPGKGEEPTTVLSSPNDSNSDTSSFQMDFSSIFRSSAEKDQRFSSRQGVYGGTSDEDENGLCRKKLRLTKDQSAFLEDSFKEHNTLNPKQKLVLANQLNLRPRQVEVWFQNRRARTKLKQTEVDCEYLKSCCETLTEENRRLQKELQELRALKITQPFYLQHPATTLTMCPSCERVVTTNSTTTSATTAATIPQQPTSGCASH
nr:homeobox-leucine zipper protein HAT14-like [Tanacetum cinerariifolium]